MLSFRGTQSEPRGNTPVRGSKKYLREAYQNACRNSDRENAIIEGRAAVHRAALTIQDAPFMQQFFDLAEFRRRLTQEIMDETYPGLSQSQPEQAPDLSGQPITREGDTITIGSGDAFHEVDITVSDEEWQTIQQVIGAADQPPHDPLAPAYKMGDTVYLDKGHWRFGKDFMQRN